MPPKVDAFADLFLSASGSKPRASMNQQQQSLYSNPSKQSGSAQNSWSDLDLLLKNGSKTGIHSLNGSSLINSPGSSTPQSRSADPFDIFQSIPTPKTKVAQQQQQPTSVSDPWDDLFNKPSKSTPPPLVQTQTQSSIKPNGSINLLDDDFTDAFTTPPPPQVQPKPQKVKELTPPIRPLSSLSSPSLKQSSSRDGVLAELIDIGFPVDIANKAIDLVGPDIQKCVNAIMEGRLNDIQQQQQASSSSSSSSTSSAGRPSQQNLNLNDISSEIFFKGIIFLI